MARTRVLVLPGWGNSGAEHWQTLWEERHGYERIEQENWDQPELESWVAALDAAVARSDERAVVVAHSLGCAVVAHWAGRGSASVGRLVGALCVAPADVDSEMHTPDEVRGFAPMPLATLPFRAIVVASRTDPYVRRVRAQQMAERWGARFVDVGRLGHINADSGIGEWPEGHRLLEELLAGS
jgi:predicted alpha/beta hydrolase family esterase